MLQVICTITTKGMGYLYGREITEYNLSIYVYLAWAMGYLFFFQAGKNS